MREAWIVKVQFEFDYCFGRSTIKASDDAVLASGGDELRLRRLEALTFLLIMLISTGCGIPRPGNPAPTRTEQTSSTLTISPTGTGTALPPTVFPTAISQLPATQAAPSDFCTDPQPVALISRFRTALQASDGEALASLISPVHGMDARLLRNGRIVNYDRESARFLFVSAFVVDWGTAPGSGLETKGSFHELMVPALLDVLNKDYSLTCNQIQVGGTTYSASWPYNGIDFYSLYDPGTSANGNLDWHTWLLGMQYVNGAPYLHAIMPFQWEP